MLNPFRPFFYLLLYVLVLYVRPHDYMPALMDLPVVPVLLLMTAAFWMFGQAKNFEAPQHRLLMWLVVAMFISVLLSGWMLGALGTAIEFSLTMVLFYITATSVDSIARFRALGIVLVIASVIIALHGIDQAAAADGIGWTGVSMIDGRITYLGALNDPNDLSMAFLITLPFTTYLANTARSFLMRLAYLAAGCVILYGVFLCNSRGSVLGLLAMLSCYSIGRFGWAKSMLVGPALLLPLLILGPSRMNEMSADEESAAGRIDAWYEGFDMFRHHPLFGVGKGLFTDYNNLTAHNSYVLAIAELGLFGYFIWLAIFVISGLMLFRLVRSSEPGREAAAALIDPAAAGQAQPAVAGPAQRPFGSAALPVERPIVANGRADDSTGDTPSWAEIQSAGRTLGYSFIGAMVSAFFLSRSYVVFLYLLVGMVVSIYQMARTHFPGFLQIRLGDMFGKLVALEVTSIVGLWILTMVLLRFS